MEGYSEMLSAAGEYAQQAAEIHGPAAAADAKDRLIGTAVLSSGIPVTTGALSLLLKHTDAIKQGARLASKLADSDPLQGLADTAHDVAMSVGSRTEAAIDAARVRLGADNPAVRPFEGDALDGEFEDGAHALVPSGDIAAGDAATAAAGTEAGAAAGAEAGAEALSAAAGLETAAGAAESTGIGAVVGAGLAVAGAVAATVGGLEELFHKKHHAPEAPAPAFDTATNLEPASF
jgi:hypothetical protein